MPIDTGTVRRDAAPGTADESGAEALVRALAELGVEVIFLNPGTDTAPVQEALARCAAEGSPAPRVVLCPHESTALAAAHAYYAVTGRPQVVMVHVDVGTQNLGAMLHNADRAQAGVVIIAGRTPTTAHGELSGGRDAVVHWHQDVPDQTGIARPYVKAGFDLVTPQTLVRQLARAVQLAGAGPAGPVYLTVAREVLMATEPAGSRPVPRRLGLPAPTGADPHAIEDAAELLAAARRPVITTSRAGRTPEAVAELVRVAELLDAPVLERRERMNFPTDHPLYVRDSAEAAAALRDADAVFVVDSDVPWVPLRGEPAAGARIVQLDPDPVHPGIPGWDFPADVRIQAHPLPALRMLADALAARTRQDAPGSARWQPTAPAPGSDDCEVLTSQAAAAVLDELLRPDDIVLDETVTNSEALRAGIGRTLPGTWFQAGGSGLGWALGGAIGAKLAAPQRRVVAVVGDGTFLFSNPAAALWSAAAAGTPVLVVVLANGGYAASARPVFELYPEGASQRDGQVIGTRFGDLVDLAALAAACGTHAEHARGTTDLRAALRRGIEVIETPTGAAGPRRSAVIVAHVGSPWLPAANRSTTSPSEPPTGLAQNRVLHQQ